MTWFQTKVKAQGFIRTAYLSALHKFGLKPTFDFKTDLQYYYAYKY